MSLIAVTGSGESSAESTSEGYPESARQSRIVAGKTFHRTKPSCWTRTVVRVLLQVDARVAPSTSSPSYKVCGLLKGPSVSVRYGTGGPSVRLMEGRC